MKPIKGFDALLYSKKTIKSILSKKSVYIFDFDGVLVDSVDIKTQAFASIYQEHGNDVVNKVISHHRLNGGMNRYKKFNFYHENFLDKKLSPDELLLMDDKFSELVFSKVLTAKEIKCSLDFISSFTDGESSYICSATPEDELRKIVSSRNWEEYFKGVYGSPVSKSKHISHIIETHGGAQSAAVFFGDAINDLDAAIESGIDFIGVGKHWKFKEPSINMVGWIKDYCELLG